MRGAAAHTGLSARKTLPTCPHRHPCTRRGHRVRRTPTLALLLHGFLSCAPGSWTPARPGPGPMPGTHWALGKVQRNRACRRGGSLHLSDEDGGAGGGSRLPLAPREKRQKTATEVRAQLPRETLVLKNRTPLRAGTGLSPWSWTGAAAHSGAWYPAGGQRAGGPAEAQHRPPGGASAPCHPCLRLGARERDVFSVRLRPSFCFPSQASHRKQSG